VTGGLTREETGQLFVKMEKEVRQATKKWLKRRDGGFRTDALHDALVRVMDMAFASPEAARVGIITAVEQAAFLHFQKRRERDRLFPAPKAWVKGGRHLTLPTEGDEEGDSVDNLPDDRPSPEEEAVRKECEEAVTALARRMDQDSSWRGELYRLLYVAGKSQAEAAIILGIAPETVWKRAERLRKYIRGTREGRRVRKARGTDT